MHPELFSRRVTTRMADRRIEYPPFRMDFQVSFDNEPEADDVALTIYNLREDTINRVEAGQTLTLAAGYGSDIGTILAGTIQEARAEWQDVDRALNLTVLDTVQDWARTPVSKSYAPGTPASRIIRDLLGTYGLEVGRLSLPDDVQYAGGKVASGTLQSVLDEIARDCGARATFAAGSVNIAPGYAGEREAVVLRYDTGLIESPQRIVDADDEKEYDVWCLLNHRIGPGSIVEIESMTANGWFRVIAGQHICNDMDFMTHLEVVGV